MIEDWHPDEMYLGAYLDGELAPEQQAKIAAHLETCTNCQQALEKLSIVFSQLASLPDVALEADLSQPVLARLRPPARLQAKPAGTDRAATRQVDRTDLFNWKVGWVALIQVGLAVLLLALFGAQAWQAWSSWLADFSGRSLAPAALFLQGRMAQIWIALNVQANTGWMAVAELVKQPLPLNIPGQQAAMIVMAAGLVWLVGNRLLLRRPVQSV